MRSDGPRFNLIHDAARFTRWSAAVAVVLLAPTLTAQSSTLLANPNGTITVETPAGTADAPPTVDPALLGPPLQPDPGSQAGPETTPGENEQPSAVDVDTEAAALVSPETSKPLGAGIGVTTSSGEAPASEPSGIGWGLRTAIALGFVIGLILLCKILFLKVATKAGGTLAAQLGHSGRAPSGLLSVLARYPVAKGSTLVLLRLDRRVLLLSQTAQGFSTLAEIDDPEEVASLIMRAEDEEGASMTRRFRTLLTQAERDPGLVGERDYEIEQVVPMTPRMATARFNDLASDPDVATGFSESDEHTDAVGSLRDRLRSLREVTA